jgi:hypothetical protein
MEESWDDEDFELDIPEVVENNDDPVKVALTLIQIKELQDESDNKPMVLKFQKEMLKHKEAQGLERRLTKHKNFLEEANPGRHVTSELQKLKERWQEETKARIQKECDKMDTQAKLENKKIIDEITILEKELQKVNNRVVKQAKDLEAKYQDHIKQSKLEAEGKQNIGDYSS